MIHTIVGGNGSGKSKFAEKWIEGKKEGKEPWIYLATMKVVGEEGRARVKKHQLQRGESTFYTLEAEKEFSKIEFPRNQGILLECMSNLVANLWYPAEGEKVEKEEVFARVKQEIEYLNTQTKQLVIVTNDVGRTRESDPLLEEFQWLMGAINCYLGKISNQVIEVVAGIPIFIKEEGR